MEETMNNYQFENVHHALVWSTETMRRESRPRISNIYDKGMLAELESAKEDATWTGFRTYLPKEKDEKLSLVSKIWKCVEHLEAEQQRIIRLSYFGDWFKESHLTNMLAIQERMRKEGKRMRLNHRYSVRQVATIMNMNYRTVHRKLDSAKASLEKMMEHNNLLENNDVLDKAG